MDSFTEFCCYLKKLWTIIKTMLLAVTLIYEIMWKITLYVISRRDNFEWIFVFEFVQIYMPIH